MVLLAVFVRVGGAVVVGVLVLMVFDRRLALVMACTVGVRVVCAVGMGVLVLCVLLALYAFGVFGYVTASLATFFVGRDADASDGEIAGTSDLENLRIEISALTREVHALSRRDVAGPPSS